LHLWLLRADPVEEKSVIREVEEQIPCTLPSVK